MQRTVTYRHLPLHRRARSEDGFSMIMMAMCVIALFGTAGLAVDLGRLYIAKNEAQTFADFTALSAARQLDGSSAGLDRARGAVNNSSMKWAFHTQTYTNSIIEFSSDRENWAENPATPTGQLYVRVTAQLANIPMYFLSVVAAEKATVRARAAAGQEPITSFPYNGLGTLPFAPLAHDPAQVSCSTGGSCFGFTPGDIITLRWPANPNLPPGPNMCPADNTQQWIDQATDFGKKSDRGYIQETSSKAIREAIEDDKINYTVTLGEPVSMTGGAKATQADSLMERAAQDTDTTSTTYAQYVASGTGNGRRIGVVPIVDASNNFVVIGFARVFLPASQPKHPNSSLCAEYIGHYFLQGGENNTGGGAGSGVYVMRLVE